MAVVGNLYKLSWGGRFFGIDQWSNNLHVLINGPVTTSAESLGIQIKTYFTDPAMRFSNKANLDYVKFNAINPVTGLYISPTFSDTFNFPTPPTGSEAPAPPQLTTAVSLTTGLLRGRGHMGRIYLPTGTSLLAVDAGGNVPAGLAAALAEGTALFLNTINADTGGRVVVFSKIAQTTTPVTGCKTGSILDTQRRRRGSLKEVYSVSSTTVA